MSKVVIITTGGTIAMQHDSVTGAAVPAVSGADLVRAIPGLGSVCDLEVREFDNLPSPAITPDHMFRLAAMVRQYLAMDDVSGGVITHGTDSLEESAYFLDLSLHDHKAAHVAGRATSWRPCAWRPHARPATWAALWS